VSECCPGLLWEPVIPSSLLLLFDSSASCWAHPAHAGGSRRRLCLPCFAATVAEGLLVAPVRTACYGAQHSCAAGSSCIGSLCGGAWAPAGWVSVFIFMPPLVWARVGAPACNGSTHCGRRLTTRPQDAMCVGLGSRTAGRQHQCNSMNADAQRASTPGQVMDYSN
jgi:hypothetical protein